MRRAPARDGAHTQAHAYTDTRARARRRISVIAALLVLVVCCAATAEPLASPAESQRSGLFAGAPRTEDGRFTNWVGELSHGTFGTRLPFMWRRLGGFFRSRPGIPERVEGAEDGLRAASVSGAPTVTWVGHSTLLVQMDGVNFLTDPTWSEHPSPVSWLGPRRFVAPGLSMEALPPIDFVVVSHNHYDHLDLPTLRALAERDTATRFFVPLGNAALLRESGIESVTEFDWGDTVALGDVVVHCLPAQHWSKRGIGDDLESLWASWAVVGVSHRFYHAGDTGYFKGFKEIGEKLGPFDLVGVPIGAYEPRAMMKPSHMNPEEAWQAALDLQARRAVAMHFGTFDLSDEPLAEAPQRFVAAAEARLGGQGAGTDALTDETKAVGQASLPEATAAWVLRIGETRAFARPLANAAQEWGESADRAKLAPALR